MFRGNGGSDCVSESTSNDGVTVGDDPAAAVADKRQQAPSDVIGDAGHLSRHQIPPAPPPPPSTTSNGGRRHDYHQLQIGAGGYDSHCYAVNDVAAATGYLPGTPLSRIPPYFASSTRANVFHSNHSLDTTGGLYSMQTA